MDGIEAPTRAGFVRFVFGTPITLRGDTLGSMLKRKVIRIGTREAIGADQGDARPARSMRRRKHASEHPALEKMRFLNELAKAASLYKEAPAKSQAQQRFMALELERHREGKKTRTGMTEKQLEEFARTSHKGLPERTEKDAGVAGAALKTVGFLAKSTFLPTTKGQLAAGGAMWAGHAGLQGAKMPTASQQLAAKRAADALLALCKESATGQALRAGVPVSLKKVVGAGTSETRRLSGASVEERPAAAGGGAHVQRPSI